MKQSVTSPKALGQFIARARKSKKLSQQQAGQSFNINQTTVSSIEQGAQGTRLETLFRLLAALDLELVVQDKKPVNSHDEVDW